MKTYCAIIDVDNYDDRDKIIQYCGESLEKAKESLAISNIHQEFIDRGLNCLTIVVWEDGKETGYYKMDEGMNTDIEWIPYN